MMTISELFLISLIQLVKGNYQKANMGLIRLGPNRRSVVDTDLDSLRPQKDESRLDVIVKHELALFRTCRKCNLVAFEFDIGVYQFIAKVWFEEILIIF